MGICYIALKCVDLMRVGDFCNFCFDEFVQKKLLLVFIINFFGIKVKDFKLSLQGKVKIDEDYRGVTEHS